MSIMSFIILSQGRHWGRTNLGIFLKKAHSSIWVVALWSLLKTRKLFLVNVMFVRDSNDHPSSYIYVYQEISSVFKIYMLHFHSYVHSLWVVLFNFKIGNFSPIGPRLWASFSNNSFLFLYHIALVYDLKNRNKSRNLKKWICIPLCFAFIYSFGFKKKGHWDPC